MRTKFDSWSFVYCFMACLAGSLFFSMSNQAKAQLTFTITGSANNFGDDGNLSPQVGFDETFTAVFVIDNSIEDSRSTPDVGTYSGAIVSSSINFSGGYTSVSDFSGGTVTVFTNILFGGVSLLPPEGGGAFLFFANTNALPTDALPTTGDEITGLPFSIWSLHEPDGVIVSINPDDGVEAAPLVLAITAPATVLGDVNKDDDITFADIPPFIDVLLADGYQAEADCDEDGDVDFGDIPSFVDILTGT